MKCPACSTNNDSIIDSRESRAGDYVRRRRLCVGCQHRWSTYETTPEVAARVEAEKEIEAALSLVTATVRASLVSRA